MTPTLKVHFGKGKGCQQAEQNCKRICKRTTQHSTTRDITNQDHRTRNTKLEHTLSY